MSALALGRRLSIDGKQASSYRLPSDHLLTHGVIVGMTGSGKTGLVTVLVEEALSAGILVREEDDRVGVVDLQVHLGVGLDAQQAVPALALGEHVRAVLEPPRVLSLEPLQLSASVVARLRQEGLEPRGGVEHRHRLRVGMTLALERGREPKIRVAVIRRVSRHTTESAAVDLGHEGVEGFPALAERIREPAPHLVAEGEGRSPRDAHGA